MTTFLNEIGPCGVLSLTVLFWICIWSGLNVHVSRMSGWHALARRFRSKGRFDGKCWRWQEVPMCGYNYMWTAVGANTQGLYLAMPRFFRLGHPNLFIPWSETSIHTSYERWMGYTWHYMDVWIPDVPSMVRFEKKLARRITNEAFPGITFHGNFNEE